MAPATELAIQEFNAERAWFMKTETRFNASPYLCVFEAAPFEQPRLLVLPEACESLPILKQQGDQAQLATYARSWERVRKLHLALPSEVPLSCRLQLMPVYEDDYETTGRIVQDMRGGRNAWEAHRGGYDSLLPAGADFVDIEAPPGSCL